MIATFDLQPDDYFPLIDRAVAEDLGAGDITSRIAADHSNGIFHLVTRQAGLLCGTRIVEAVLNRYDEAIEIEWAPAVRDGRPLLVKQPLATLKGPSDEILSAERVMLNFLQRLCGVATLTHRFVEAVVGTAAKIYDTRKTTPGWRALEKYAVRCGGGHNHRMGLYDAILIKDNPLAGVPPDQLPRRLFDMLNAASQFERKPAFVEVEVDDLDQLDALFKVVGIDVILLDNFTLDRMRRAVEMRDALGLAGKIALEASGRVNLDTVRQVAQTGVDRIAVGALTHSPKAIDLALDPAY